MTIRIMTLSVMTLVIDCCYAEYHLRRVLFMLSVTSRPVPVNGAGKEKF